MNKILSLTTILFTLLFFSISDSQNLPKYYKLNRTGALTKSNSGNPSGNEVQDIVSVGDTIWIVSVDYAFMVEQYSAQDRHIIGVSVNF